MGFKVREIWAWSLGILTLFYALIGKGIEGNLIDLLLAVLLNAGIGFLIGTAISAFNKRRTMLNNEKADHSSSTATTTFQRKLVQNQEIIKTANSSELSDFLNKLPEPLASENGSMTNGWFSDPLKRWSSRFNQGQGEGRGFKSLNCLLCKEEIIRPNEVCIC